MATAAPGHEHMTIFWIGFNAFVVVMLLLDLFVFHRHSHVIGFKEALRWSAFWISLAMAFAVFVYFWRGPHDALTFLTGYLIEESLSVDNLFVFLVIFSYFRVPRENEYKVLFWGAHQPLSLDHLCFRRVPDLHRHQAVQAERDRGSSGAQPAAQAAAAAGADHQGLSRR
jgi:hypothetical protein